MSTTKNKVTAPKSNKSDYRAQRERKQKMIRIGGIVIAVIALASLIVPMFSTFAAL